MNQFSNLDAFQDKELLKDVNIDHFVTGSTIFNRNERPQTDYVISGPMRGLKKAWKGDKIAGYIHTYERTSQLLDLIVLYFGVELLINCYTAVLRIAKLEFKNGRIKKADSVGVFIYQIADRTKKAGDF